MSKLRKKQWRPYVMRGRPAVTKSRPTMDDEPDRRVPPVIVNNPLRPLLSVPKRGIPMPLLAPHRIMLRWARSIGDGLPAEEWDDDRRSSTLTPLDDETAIVIDQTVLHSPCHVQTILRLWYKSPLPVFEIARKLSVDRNEVRQRWLASLTWLRPELKNHGVL